MSDKKDNDGKIINLLSKRKMELAGEIMDSDPNSLYQSILFLELYSMEAFRVEELLRCSDEGDAHYYDLVRERDRLLGQIQEEKHRITLMGAMEDYDTTEFTDGAHPEWECDVLTASFGSEEE